MLRMVKSLFIRVFRQNPAFFIQDSQADGVFLARAEHIENLSLTGVQIYLVKCGLALPLALGAAYLLHTVNTEMPEALFSMSIAI